MENKNSFWKAIFLGLVAAFLTHQLGKRQAEQQPTKRLPTKEGWQPLAPIRKLFWLCHPQKALYFFLLQQSLGVTWRVAKKYFSTKS